MITQRRLQHLLVLVEHAHFGRAAQSLNISQPALSKSIQALEAELGVMLLDRQRGVAALTAFGELVAQRGKTWLTAEDDLRREIAMLAGKDIGSLKLALAPYPAILSGFTSAARLLARHPTLSLRVREANWLDVIHCVNVQAVDLGIAEIGGLEKHEQLATEILGQHQGHFFCRPGHPLLDQGPVTLAQLLEYPWVSTRITRRIAASFPKTPGRAGKIDPATGDLIPAIEIDTPLQFARFLKNSDAIAPSVLTAMEAGLHGGEIVVLPTADLPLRTQYGFIYLKNRSLPPAAIAYMQEVRAEEEAAAAREADLAARFAPGWTG